MLKKPKRRCRRFGYIEGSTSFRHAHPKFKLHHDATDRTLTVHLQLASIPFTVVNSPQKHIYNMAIHPEISYAERCSPTEAEKVSRGHL